MIKALVAIILLIVAVLALIGCATLYVLFIMSQDDREMAKKHRINNQSSE